MLPTECDEPVDTACPCDTLWTGSTRWSRPGLRRHSNLRSTRSPHRLGRRPPSRQGKPAVETRLVLWLVPVELDTPTELVTDCDWVSVVLDPTVFELLDPTVSELLFPVVSVLLFPVVSVLLFPTESLQVLPSCGRRSAIQYAPGDRVAVAPGVLGDCDCPWDVPRERLATRTGFARPLPSGGSQAETDIDRSFRRDATEEVISATRMSVRVSCGRETCSASTWKTKFCCSLPGPGTGSRSVPTPVRPCWRRRWRRLSSRRRAPGVDPGVPGWRQ